MKQLLNSQIASIDSSDEITQLFVWDVCLMLCEMSVVEMVTIQH